MQKRITFKNSIISRTIVKNNIKRVWDSAPSKIKENNWYMDAHLFVKDITKNLHNSDEKSFRIGCGVLAAYSPMKSWSMNKELAKKALSTKEFKGHTRLFNRKASAIFISDGTDDTIYNILRGQKIKDFYYNICYPDNPENRVVVDRHALCCALGKVLSDEELSMTELQYRFFSDCYRYTADRLGVPVNHLQAVTWEQWKNLKKKNNRTDNVRRIIQHHRKKKTDTYLQAV